MTNIDTDNWSTLRSQYLAASDEENTTSTRAAVKGAIDALVHGFPGEIRSLDGELPIAAGGPLDVLQQATFCALKILALVDILGETEEVGDIRLRDFEHAGNVTEILMRFVDQVLVYDDGQASLPFEHITAVMVREGRALNMSWRRIGKALSMTGPGIFKKARAAGWIDETDLVEPESID